MPTQEDIGLQEALLRANRQTLDILLKQQAMFSAAYAPPAIFSGITEARSKITNIKQTLRDWGVAVEDLPNDTERPSELITPPPLPVQTGGIHAEGDAMVTNVGNDARDVVVIGKGASDVTAGKNIFKVIVGTLTIPALPIVATLVLALISSATGLWLYLVPSQMPPPPSFNVAVADFEQIDDGGQMHVTNDSKLISTVLATTLQSQLKQLSADFPALVWNDSMTILQKRGTIGVIAGDPATACQRAPTLNAAIIVYGTLDARTNPALLRLQFCIRSSSTNPGRDTGNLQELQGIDRFGGPLQISLPITEGWSPVNPTLRIRTTLLAMLVVGLRYELFSEDDFHLNLQLALKAFQGALDYLDQVDAASNNNGRDLVHYFIGRENFLLFQDADTPEKDKPALLDAARTAFEQATQVNTTYARAWSALGSVYYLDARQDLFSQRSATAHLEQSIDAYQTAIRASQANQDRPAETEARLALAQGYWLQADAFLRQDPSDNASAETSLQRAGDQLDLGTNLIQPDQNRFSGYAAMVRGLVAHWHAQIGLRTGDLSTARAQFELAGKSYRQCIDAGTKDPRDQFLQRQIIQTTCIPKAANVTQALQQMGSHT